MSRMEKTSTGSAIINAVWEVTVERLAEKISEKDLRFWLPHMRLLSIKEQTAKIVFSEDVDANTFKNTYGSLLLEALSWACEENVQIEYIQDRPNDVNQKKNTKTKKNVWVLLVGIVLILLAGLLTVIFLSLAQNAMFKETFYQIGSTKVDGNLRVIQLSDLHDVSYGNNNEKLLSRIEELQPDLIILSGDIIDQDNNSHEGTFALCSSLTSLAPVYYIYGNNEVEQAFGFDMTLNSLQERFQLSKEENLYDNACFQSLDDPLKDRLEELGVDVLWNETATVKLQEATVDIYGVLTSNPSAFWPFSGIPYSTFMEENTDHFKLMVSHEPYVFNTFSYEYWADLVLCGHTHGGVIRLPYVGGLYDQTIGFFPEAQGNYVAGEYSIGGHPLIVSTGLTNEGIRINNQPELVIVDINQY